MKRIYYIENLKQHFTAVQKFLNGSEYEVFPLADNWAGELEVFQNFIYNQDSPEERNALKKVFSEARPDLVIIDIDLGCNNAGDGEDVYQNFMLREKDLHRLPVIYLTVDEKKGYEMNKKVRHVDKTLSGFALDIAATGPALRKVIEEMLLPEEKKGFFDRLIDSV